MATKTVINTKMPQACGISIVIDQDQAQQQQQRTQRQPLDIGKITIYQSTTAKLTTTPTTATKTPIVATTADRIRTVVAATLKEVSAVEEAVSVKEGQQVPGVDFNAAQTLVKTKMLIDFNRNNYEQHNAGVDNEHAHHENAVANYVATNNVNGQRNRVGRPGGEFHTVNNETSYTTTATFPHLLLKVAAPTQTQTQTETSVMDTATKALSSVRGKAGVTAEIEAETDQYKVENENGHNDKVGKSQMQRSSGANGHSLNGHNNDANTTMSTRNAQSEKRTMIIECNSARHNLAGGNMVNGNNEHNEHNEHNNKQQHNNNVEVGVHVGADDVVNIADHAESRVTGVARIGQNAFIGICANGVSAGDGVGASADDQQQLESTDAAIDVLSLTTKADCASALTETVSPGKDAHLNANNSTLCTASQTSPSHVVKIQIKQSKTNKEVHESERQAVTVVTLNEDTNKYQTKTKTKTLTETEIKIEPSKTQLVRGESVSNNNKNNNNNNNHNHTCDNNYNKANLHLNIESRMVQRPIMSTATATTAMAAAAATATTTAIGATDTGSGIGTVAGADSVSGKNAGNNSSGGTTITELNVTHPSYLYYVMTSGQFSPCDTLDSGTGSDLESSGNHNGTPSPKVLNAQTNDKLTISNAVVGGVGVDSPKLEMHLKTTKIRLTGSKKETLEGHQQQLIISNNEHARAGSLTDSEESESSSLSCDSLHSSEFIRQSSMSPIVHKTSNNTCVKMLGAFLPDSLLRDIRDRKFPANDFETKYGNDDLTVDADADDESATSPSPTETEDAINEAEYSNAEHVKFLHEHNLTNAITNKRASMPSKTFRLNTENGTFVDTKMNSMPRKYEADKYYQFHVKEHENFRSFGKGNGNGILSDLQSLEEYESARGLHDDAFAGYKDIRCGSATSTIRSSKGTVRGVKNRVRNGIATFLQLQQPNVKNFKEKDAGKVVLYTTSMGIIRDTYAKCANVKQILRTLLIKFEERDVFMSIEYQQEIKERMHSETIRVPQLFVEGQHIGDADTVERLNESGELRQLLKPYKSIATTFTCQTCGGYRLLPCPSCNGSKKSVHRNHFTAEFVALKCMNCDEVGLVKCHNC